MRQWTQRPEKGREEAGATGDNLDVTREAGGNEISRCGGELGAGERWVWEEIR